MITMKKILDGCSGDGDKRNPGKRLNDPFFFAGAMGAFMPSAAPGAGFMAVSSRERKKQPWR